MNRIVDITVTLTFVRTMSSEATRKLRVISDGEFGIFILIFFDQCRLTLTSQVIHTQSPLYLESGMFPLFLFLVKNFLAVLISFFNQQEDDEKVLTLDTLAIHMIRANTNSTIISYHPNHKGDANLTKGLHAKFRLIGSSVYWKNIFSATTDITFLFLAILWQGIYAWDEALETLYVHISHLVRDIFA
jgi:hypothetical protein